MTKKILVWLDDKYAYLHYGLCLELSKLDDFEFYGFVAQKNDYDFLQSQKKLSFKELCYYSKSYIDKQQKPDLEYLKKIETDYELNLWLLAYTERTFLEERNFFHKFNSDEILFIIESLLKLYLDFFKRVKPDFIIMQKTGENIANSILFHLAKSMNIDTWMFTETRLENSFVLSNDLEGNTIKHEFERIMKNPPENMKSYNHDYIIQKSVSKMINDFLEIEFGKSTSKQKIKRYLKRIFDNNEQIYLNKGKSKSKMLEWRIKHHFELKNRINFLDKHTLKNIPNENFIYFPLPVQPESQNNAWAPFQTNLYSIIENIAKSIPANHFLYVKEHPAQGSKYWRPIEFYKKILFLPNVKLFHPTVDNHKLLSSCKILVTINSSSGLEALFYKKPIIVFADAFYDSLSMVRKIKDVSTLPLIIRELLSSFTFNDFELSCLVESIEAKQLLIPYWTMMKDIASISSLNVHTNFETTMSKFDKFFEKYKPVFSIMAKSYYSKL